MSDELFGFMTRPSRGQRRIALMLARLRREGDRLVPMDDTIRIDLPECEVDRWDASLVVPLGRPALISAAPDPARPGGMVALVALVRADR